MLDVVCVVIVFCPLKGYPTLIEFINLSELIALQCWSCLGPAGHVQQVICISADTENETIRDVKLSGLGVCFKLERSFSCLEQNMYHYYGYELVIQVYGFV